MLARCAIGLYQNFTVDGFIGIASRNSRKGGRARGSEDGSPPVGSRGETLVGGLGDFVPQKLKQNVKLLYNF